MQRKLSFILAAFLMAAPNLWAETYIYVQNNTTSTFSVSASQSGYSLSSSKWGRSTSSVPIGQRKKVLWFNRDSGIKNGKDFYFTTALKVSSQTLNLKQKLNGNWIGSDMWQSASSSTFSHSWYKDRSTHTGSWNLGTKVITVKYRAYATGGDDHIEYILQEALEVMPSDSKTLNVLAYNIYMRPEIIFANGQAIRANLIPGRVHGYDVIVFSEAFDNSSRSTLLNGLKAEYPYKTNVVGSDSGIDQDGGVILVSKWPIEKQAQRVFGSECSGSDCMSDKGVIYARLNKQGRIYHVFGSHTQAWSTAQGAAVRRNQFQVIFDFIYDMDISPNEPVIITGDLNVDMVNYWDEYSDMLFTLDASHPDQIGYAYSADPVSNVLADKSNPREYLDYVLYSNNHLRPYDSYNEVRMIRSSEEWKEFFWEPAMWDLSDHYAVYGRLSYP